MGHLSRLSRSDSTQSATWPESCVGPTPTNVIPTNVIYLFSSTGSLRMIALGYVGFSAAQPNLRCCETEPVVPF